MFLPTLCKIERFCGGALSQSSVMKRKELTPKQMPSVPSPTRGGIAGMRCTLYSGGLHFELHVSPKLSAIEALERK